MYGTASEDMDSLTFATPKLIRNLMKPGSQAVPINEYDYDKARLFGAACAPSDTTHLHHAEGLGAMALCTSAGAGGPEADARPVCGHVHPVRLRLPGHHQGCVPNAACQASWRLSERKLGGLVLKALVPGIGGVRALTLIQKHGSLDKVLASLDPGKYDVPDPFPYEEARRMFKGAPAPLLCTARQEACRQSGMGLCGALANSWCGGCALHWSE